METYHEPDGRISRRDFHRCNPAARPGWLHSRSLHRCPRRNGIPHRRPVRDDPGNRSALAGCPGFHGEIDRQTLRGCNHESKS